jgi:hypothetical protein
MNQVDILLIELIEEALKQPLNIAAKKRRCKLGGRAQGLKDHTVATEIYIDSM